MLSYSHFPGKTQKHTIIYFSSCRDSNRNKIYYKDGLKNAVLAFCNLNNQIIVRFMGF